MLCPTNSGIRIIVGRLTKPATLYQSESCQFGEKYLLNGLRCKIVTAASVFERWQ